jgi:hypothetical protein
VKRFELKGINIKTSNKMKKEVGTKILAQTFKLQAVSWEQKMRSTDFHWDSRI